MQKPWKEYLLPLECLYLQSSQIEHHKKKEVEKEPFFLCLKDHLQKKDVSPENSYLDASKYIEAQCMISILHWANTFSSLEIQNLFLKIQSIFLRSKSAYTFERKCMLPSLAVLKTLNMLSCKNFHGWKNHLRVPCWNCLQFYFLENCHICYLFDQEGGSNLIRLKEAIATVWRLIWKWGRQAFLGKVFQIGVAFCEQKNQVC